MLLTDRSYRYQERCNGATKLIIIGESYDARSELSAVKIFITSDNHAKFIKNSILLVLSMFANNFYDFFFQPQHLVSIFREIAICVCSWKS